MKPKPFDRVKRGDIFRDLDGNLLMKIPKTGEGDTFNTTILISNKKDTERGSLASKARDSYCEVLNENEIATLRLDTSANTEESILSEDIIKE